MLKQSSFPIKIHHVVYFMCLVLCLPKSGFYFDQIDRPEWIAYMKTHGFINVYGSGSNYLPLALYILYFFGAFFQNPADIKTYFYLFKIIVLLFDFAAAIGIVYYFRQFSKKKYLEYLVLMNIAYLYNTLFWGQQDGIHCALMIFALIFLLEKQPLLGVLFTILAVNAKLQSVIILPIVGILLIPHILYRNDEKWQLNGKLLAKIIGVAVSIQVLILLPFLLSHRLNEVISVMKNSVGFFPSVSWGAYNLWYLLTPIDPAKIMDSEIFHHFTYKKWGFLLFFGLSALALLPLVLMTLKRVLQQSFEKKEYFENVMLTTGLISIIFFFVNTQMHERYSHPALLFYFAFGVLSGRFWLFGLTSIAYFFNLDGIYQYFHIYLHIPLVKPELISLLFLLILSLNFLEIYRKVNLFSKT